jgi:pimeloyl-ACP methyl ester carboxylesterase
MPYCEVADGVALYYEDFGEGSPVVFTNAGNLTHKMWMGQVAALAPAFRTITYDIRGTGFSAKLGSVTRPTRRPPSCVCSWKN